MKKKRSSSSLPSHEELTKKIRSFISSHNYEPMSQTAIIKHLKLPPSAHSEVKAILSEFLSKGLIRLKKTNIEYCRSTPSLMRGTLRMHPRGFGFVIPQNKEAHPLDVFIPKHLTDSAVDGDLVEVEIFGHSKKDKGPEGKIHSVIERARSHLAGIAQVSKQERVTVYIPLLGPNKPAFVIAKQTTPPKDGDRVIVKVVDWGSQHKPILCEISHVIGHISDPSIDVHAAIEEFHLKSAFPAEAIKQAKSYGKTVSPKQLKDRLNLTKTECFTIDPTTAKDFDDALSLSKDEKGNYHLGVHIADVAYYVPPNSPLDLEAMQRGNSTYFPGTCIPMLPEELSNHLCSLKPSVVRLCISVLVTFDKEGELLHYEIKRSYIKSAKRFTYEEAKEVLDGKKKSIHLPTLQLMVELCHLLKKKRRERGSIDFALPEVVLMIDEQGAPKGFHIVEYDITHQLVEEYMLKANELVAKHLSEKVKELLYRVHEEPSEENMQDFFMLARSFGFQLPQKPGAKEIQLLFEEAKTTRFTQQLSVAFIRSMKLAYYSPENVGHFGLALEHYSHFTSPIRRYPDLIIQRLLFAEQPEETDLKEIAESCSEKERISFKAEQSVKTLKKLRLLKRYYEENPDQIYSCTISKIKPFGIFFEIDTILIEGFVHISELGKDYYIYEPIRNSLIGERTHVRYCIGDAIQTKIQSIHLHALEVKWALLSEIKSTSEKGKKKKRRK